MDIKIYLTPTMGFLITEVYAEDDDSLFIRNPRYLQAYIVPDGQNSQKLSIQLSPVIYRELLKDGVEFETKLKKSEYQDVSDMFNDHAFDMYQGIEGTLKDAYDSDDEEECDKCGSDCDCDSDSIVEFKKD